MKSEKNGKYLVTQLCPTLCDPMNPIALQALLCMGFPRHEYQSGLPFPSPGDLPDIGIEPGLLHDRKIPYYLNHQESPVISGNKLILSSEKN